MKKNILVGLALLIVLLGPTASIADTCRCPRSFGNYILVQSTCIQDIYGCACECVYELFEP
jgi:hypothetical protein